VVTCVPCQRNKPSNTLPAGKLKPLPIPTRNWEVVTMDRITSLPKTTNGKDSIIVFVCKLSKQAHFVATMTNITAPELAVLFFQQVVRHHGLPKIIVSDRDPLFTSNFWRALWQ